MANSDFWNGYSKLLLLFEPPVLSQRYGARAVLNNNYPGAWGPGVLSITAQPPPALLIRVRSRGLALRIAERMRCFGP